MYSLLFTILVMVFTTIQSLQAKVWDNDRIRNEYKSIINHEKYVDDKKKRSITPNLFLVRFMEDQHNPEDPQEKDDRAETVLSIFGTMGPFTPKGTMRGYMKGWSVSAIKTALDTLGKDKVDGDLDERFNSLFNLNTLNDDLMTNEAYQRHLEALWIIFQTYHKVKVKEVTPLTKIKKDGKEIKISVKEPVDHEVKKGPEGKKEVKSQDELFQEKVNRYQGLFQQASAWGGGSPMDKLPVEIQEKILGYVTAPNDIKNARLVNRQWNTMVPKLNPKPLIIDLSKLNSLEELDTILKKAEGVQWVKIDGTPKVMNQEEWDTAYNALSDNDQRQAYIGAESFYKKYPTFPRKKYLTDDVIQKVGKVLGKTLTGLFLRGNAKITNPEVLKDYTNLEFLRMDSFNDLNLLNSNELEKITNLDNLKSLKIFHSNASGFYTNLIRNGLDHKDFKLKNLEYLVIQDNLGRSATGILEKLIADTEKFKKIKKVEFKYGEYQAVDLKQYLDGLIKAPFFQGVDAVFIGYSIVDKGGLDSMESLFKKDGIKRIGFYKSSGDKTKEVIQDIINNAIKDFNGETDYIARDFSKLLEKEYLWKDIIPDLPKEFMKYEF